MRLQVKNKHFLKRVDDKFVSQLYQIIKEFEAFEKICFKFISNRQTSKSTNKQKRLENFAKKRRVLHSI